MIKNIETFDDFLQPGHRRELFEIAQKSLFEIGWDDTIEVEKRHQPCLHSRYNFNDTQRLKIWEPILKAAKNSSFKNSLKIDNFNNCVLNLTKPGDINYIHTHPGLIAVLYYINLTWRPEWGGETLFYKNNAEDIVYTSPFKPNRLIVFDGNTPHTVKAQNYEGPSYRFTVSLFFKK